MSATAACRQCRRANAPHRETCIYCGAVMPNPTAPPPPKPKRELPADLDLLVRRAMNTGSVGELKKALESAGREQGGPQGGMGEVSVSAGPSSGASGAMTNPATAATRGASGGAGGTSGGVPGAPSGATFAGVGAGGADGSPRGAGTGAGVGVVGPGAGGTGAEVGGVAPGAGGMGAGVAGNVPGAGAASATGAGFGALHGGAPGVNPTIDPTPTVAEDEVLSGALPAPSLLPHALEALTEAATAARAAPRAGLEAALSRVDAALAEARRLLAEAPELPPIALPKVRLPYGLAVAAVSPTLDDLTLARALGVDASTARQVRLAGHARIALRGADAEALETRAAAVRAAGISAAVLDSESLLAFGPALTVVGTDATDRWRVVAAPLWEERPDPSPLPRGAPIEIERPLLLVPGEVEERSVRATAADSRWARSRYTAGPSGGERRRMVLDLHVEGRILRLVEGLVDLRALPGADPASQRRSLAALTGALLGRWPGLPVEPRRVCAVSADLRAPDGWAEWEEHSRVCRLLA